MGDDLGDDYEYLTAKIRGNTTSDDDDDDEASSDHHSKENSKRKRKNDDEDDNNDDDDDDDDDDDENAGTTPPLKKQNVQLESSRNILEMDPPEQATFLSVALSHYTRMSLDDDDNNNNNNNNNEDSKDTTTTTNPMIPSVKRLTKFLAQPKDTTAMKNANCFLDRLLLVCSKKRLKRHSAQGSPSIVIVCQSARRAVAILKECAPLGVQALKLFPKQAPLNQQAQECQRSTAALAVGTPHRLLALVQHGAMKLDQTQVLVLDGATSNKNFTVCTLPDTAHDCMKLVVCHVLPELARRKDFRLSFC